MIQYLSQSKKGTKASEIDFNSFSEPNSLDLYEVNVLDFSDQYFWCYNGNNTYHVNSISDLTNLKIMINKSKNTKFFVIFPQDLSFRFNSGVRDYLSSIRLKNMISSMNTIINTCIATKGLEPIFEINYTSIDELTIKSDFYFDISGANNIDKCLVSTSDKVTAVRCKNVIYSTLDINGNSEYLFSVIKAFDFIKVRADAPIWFEDTMRLNDKLLLEQKSKLLEQQKSVLAELQNTNKKIEMNNYYKSILYSQGDELVNVVFDMLDIMIGINLHHFKDVKKEDFIFLDNGTYFIGEIKGVNENVKNKHISQLYTHIEVYRDKFEIDEALTRGLLIINPLRKTAPDKRAEIHQDQIDKAENMFNVLIVRTEDFLELFDQFLKKILNKDDILGIFRKQKGLISLK